MLRRVLLACALAALAAGAASAQSEVVTLGGEGCPADTYDDPRAGDPQIGTVHPLTGPVHIVGAERATCWR